MPELKNAVHLLGDQGLRVSRREEGKTRRRKEPEPEEALRNEEASKEALQSAGGDTNTG